MSVPTYKINEIYDSIDGEFNGFRGMGQPSTFIRLVGCNLNCAWCDTKYTLLDTGENTQEMTIPTILEKINLPHVTLTGGEPLLQDIEPLVNTLQDYDLVESLTIETNGSIMIEQYKPQQALSIAYMVDYKLPSSGMSDHNYKDLFSQLMDWDAIKFVCARLEDFYEAVSMIKRYEYIKHPILAPHLIFSPVSVDRQEDWTRELLYMVLKLATDEPCLKIQYSPQLHKLIGVK